MRIIKQIATTLLLTAQMMAASTGAWADEGGTSFWLPGQYASFAAVPPIPGWSLATEIYYYSGEASASKTFAQGETLSVGFDSREAQLLLTPSYTPLTKVLGGSPALSLTGGYGRNWVQEELSVSSRANALDRSDAVSGLTDLSPTASLAWNRGVHNGMIYLTGNIPVGSYDSQRLANIGIGFWAVDAGGGYTYFNQQTGREFSAVVGATYNFENTSTDYQNGIDSHLDWSISQLLSAAWGWVSPDTSTINSPATAEAATGLGRSNRGLQPSARRSATCSKSVTGSGQRTCGATTSSGLRTGLRVTPCLQI